MTLETLIAEMQNKARTGSVDTVALDDVREFLSQHWPKEEAAAKVLLSALKFALSQYKYMSAEAYAIKSAIEDYEKLQKIPVEPQGVEDAKQQLAETKKLFNEHVGAVSDFLIEFAAAAGLPPDAKPKEIAQTLRNQLQGVEEKLKEFEQRVLEIGIFAPDSTLALKIKAIAREVFGGTKP